MSETKDTEVLRYEKRGARQSGTLYIFRCPHCDKKMSYETAMCWNSLVKQCEREKCNKYFNLINNDRFSVTLDNPIAYKG